MTQQSRTYDHTDASSTQPIPAVDPQQALLKNLGGPWGMVYTAIPVVVFVAANAVFPLPVTIGIALAVALLLTVVRKLRGERLSSAAGGLISVAACGGMAALTGSPNGFFLLGIWSSLVGAVVTLASLLVRRPLTGVLWNAFYGGKYAWREDRPTLRVHDLATLAWALVFAARFVVKQWLYLADATGWLGFAKIAMGTPMTVLGVLVVIWAARRSSKRLVKPTKVRTTDRF